MLKRRPFIAGNWKMNKTNAEAVESAQSLLKLVSGVTDVDIVIAPTFVSLSLVAETIKDSPISLSAQNVYCEKKGAYTGEISSEMLISSGCRYVIIGHSERRQYFNESNNLINKKVKMALEENLSPIFCIGETENERVENKTISVLDKQLQKGLEDVSSDELENLVIAYEPVWAIGTGKTATDEQAQEVHSYIRSFIEKNYGEKLASSIRIVYGGSVKPSNIKNLMSMPDIDGALVGGASLDSEVFAQIVHFNK